jgi:CHRD domain-containing protein
MSTTWRTSRFRRHLPLAAALVTAGVLASGGSVAVAGSGDDQRQGSGQGRSFQVPLSGYQETPQTLSTAGSGTFRLKIDREGTLSYTLSYQDLEGSVTQAHIHFGATALSGGVSTWLCGTPAFPGPAGTPACPASPGSVSGTLDAADVLGPAEQGIAPGEMDELVAAIRAGATYANVHTDLRATGEIRGQIGHGHHDDEDDDD